MPCSGTVPPPTTWTASSNIRDPSRGSGWPCCSASSPMARSRSASARSATWTWRSWRTDSVAGDTAKPRGRRSRARSPRRRPRCWPRRGSISTGASGSQERPHEVSLREVPAGPHPPQEVAPRERTRDGRIAPPAPVQLVDSLAQLDQEVELVAQPCRALLHAPAVLAKQHPRLERQHPPQRIHHRVHVFVGAEVAEPGGDRKSTRLNSSHLGISYAVFCLKKKKNIVCPERQAFEETDHNRGSTPDNHHLLPDADKHQGGNVKRQTDARKAAVHHPYHRNMC